MSQLNVNTIAPQSGSTVLFSGTISGSDMNLSGDVTAQRFIVSSSVTKLNIITNSGSTAFGDTLDDTHKYTGSLQLTGSITASKFSGDGSGLSNVFEGTTPSASISTRLTNLVTGGVVLTHVTASGNISASGTVYASKFESAGASGETISFNDNLNITGHITASGNISSSASSTGSFGSVVIGTTDRGGSSDIFDSVKFYVQSAVNKSAAAIKSNGSGHALALEGSGNNFLFLTNGGTGGHDDWKIAKGSYGLRIQADKTNLSVLELRPEASSADTTAALTITNAGGARQAVITSGDGTYSGSLKSTGSFGHTLIDSSLLVGRKTPRSATTLLGLEGDAGDDGIVYFDFDNAHSGGNTRFRFLQNGNEKANIRFDNGDDDFYISNRVNDDNADIVIVLKDGTNIHRFKGDGTSIFAGDVSGSLASTGSFGQVDVGGKTLLKQFITGSNLFIGDDAGTSNSPKTLSGQYNVGIGSGSLKVVSSTTNYEANENTSIGYLNLTANTTGYGNTGVGAYSLLKTNTGHGNTGLGNGALRENLGGARNTAVGAASVYKNTTGDYNTGVGRSAIEFNQTGDNNTAVGYYAMAGASGQSNSNNAAFGMESLKSVTTGGSNSTLGYQAGDVITTGQQNVILGAGADPSANSAANQIVIGYNATGKGDNKTVIGNSSQTHVIFGGTNTLISGSASSTGSFGLLEIAGATFASDGNDFGIGTTSPTSPGGFAKTLQISTPDDGASLTFTSDNDGTARHFEVGNASNGRAVIWNRDDSSNGYIQFGTDATRRMMITKDGDVTISSTLYASGNNAKLYVDGNVLVETHITASGNISGSVTSTGSFGTIQAKGVSLSNNDAGIANTIFGKNAGLSLDAGSNYNVFIGEGVSDATMNDAVNNVGIGFESLTALTAGDNNVAIGYRSLYTNNTGYSNIALGNEAGRQTSNGFENVSIGEQTGYSNISGDQNISIGKWAGYYNTAGNNTVAIGQKALFRNLASDNTAVGDAAGQYVTSATNLTLLGHDAGDAITTGDNNTIIGAGSDVSSGSAENEIVIGYAVTGLGDNQTVIGNSSQTHVVFGGSALISGSAGSTGSFGQLKLSNENGDVDIRNTVDGAMNVIIGDSTTGAALTSGADNVIIGQGIAAITGENNVYIGAGAAAANSSPNNNVAIGYQAMVSGNGNASNVAIGFRTLYGNGSCTNTVAVGFEAGKNTTTGEENAFYGYRSGDTNTTGDKNVTLGMGSDVSTADAQNQIAIGHNVTSTGDNQTVIGNSDQTHVVFGGNALISGSLKSTGSFGKLLVGGSEIASSPNATDGSQSSISGSAVSTGSFGTLKLVNYNQGYGNINNTHFGVDAGAGGINQKNVAIGYEAMSQEVDSGKNVAIGYQAMREVQNTDQVVAIGHEAGKVTNLDNSVFIGYNAGSAANTFGSVVIGASAGVNLTGKHNVLVGGDAGGSNTGGEHNVFVGFLAGYKITTGDKNVFIGAATSGSGVNAQNRIAIGSGSLNHEDNTTVIGNSSHTKVTFAGADGVILGDANGNISGSAKSTGSFGACIIGTGPNAAGGFGGSSDLHPSVKLYVQSKTNQPAAAIKSNGSGYALTLEGSGNNFMHLTNGNTGGLDDWNIGVGNYGLRVQSDKTHLPVLELRPAASSQASTNALTVSTHAGVKSLEINAATGTVSGSSSSTGSFARVETKEFIGHRPIKQHYTDFSASADYGGYYNIVNGNMTCSILHHNTASVAIGTEYEFFQTGSTGRGLFFETGSSGVTVLVKNNNFNLAGQYSGATLKKVAQSTWHLVGDLT